MSGGGDEVEGMGEREGLRREKEERREENIRMSIDFRDFVRQTTQAQGCFNHADEAISITEGRLTDF